MITQPVSSGKRRLKSLLKVAALIALVIACVAGGLLLTSPNSWKKWGAANVTLNGQPSSGSIAYRSHAGAILLYLKAPSSTMLQVYVIEPDSHKVGIPPGNNVNLLRLPGYVYSTHGRLLTVPLDGTEEKMDKFDAKLTVKPKYLEFTSLQGGRVRVAW